MPQDADPTALLRWIRAKPEGEPDNLALWREKYGTLANSDCPVIGEGLSHAWTGDGLNMACTACGLNIPSKPS